MIWDNRCSSLGCTRGADDGAGPGCHLPEAAGRLPRWSAHRGRHQLGGECVCWRFVCMHITKAASTCCSKPASSRQLHQCQGPSLTRHSVHIALSGADAGRARGDCEEREAADDAAAAEDPRRRGAHLLLLRRRPAHSGLGRLHVHAAMRPSQISLAPFQACRGPTGTGLVACSCTPCCLCQWAEACSDSVPTVNLFSRVHHGSMRMPRRMPCVRQRGRARRSAQ